MSCTGCAQGAGGKPAGCKNNGYCSTSGCNKLDVFDWLAGVPLPGGQAPFDAVEVRFKGTRKAFYRNPPSGGLSLMTGDLVAVECSSGFDVGLVSIAGELARAQMQRKLGNTDSFALRKVLHKATQAEIDAWQAARGREQAALEEARRTCQEARLDLKVSDVEFQGDGSRATVYYTAEERVDFRGLVRKLADRLQAQVDLKQLGARQEAARVGGIGSCGRELCCSTWLTDLRSVTTSAARYQQLALNPQKLAGQCGKLKCCLNYELDQYIEAIKSYPSQNAKLRTKQGVGTHMKTDIFTARMWYLFKKPGEAPVMAGFPVDAVRDILAKNKEGQEPEVDLHLADEAPAVHAGEERTEYGNVIDGSDDIARFDKKVKHGGRKHGGDRKKRGTPGPAKAGAKQAEGAPKPAATGERRSRDARGRRRKGPRPAGDNRGGERTKPSDA